ncbi:MAG: hypothetical protein HYU73_09780 [Betaproteobacteria bacterium]|nr:hypothetical protein [Betaproteobacteria bacterium]
MSEKGKNALLRDLNQAAVRLQVVKKQSERATGTGDLRGLVEFAHATALAARMAGAADANPGDDDAGKTGYVS